MAKYSILHNVIFAIRYCVRIQGQKVRVTLRFRVPVTLTPSRFHTTTVKGALGPTRGEM